MRSKRAEALAQTLLRDRAEHAERQRERQAQRPKSQSLTEIVSFDPYDVAKWTVIAPIGADPGYLPRTPMRAGAVGFYIACRCCGKQFESKGLAYCTACMDLPAEERHAIRPATLARMCEAPGCENPISRRARADIRYCSQACRERARRARKRDG